MAGEEHKKAKGKRFGIRNPPLYVTIKTFLDRYPDGQIFKELIQNADDAGATVVRFYLDPRQHEQKDLVDPALAKFQGPALLAYNDAPLTPEDWEGIQKPQCSNKANNPLKVGKFGIGFNSIYHITDLPTIISGQMKLMGILDPQEEIWENQSGESYAFSKVQNFKDTVAPYNKICDFSTSFSGTLFRFPLRTKKSKLSNNCHTISSLRKLFDAFRKEAHCLLLFLKSVVTVEIIELPEISKVQFHVSIVDNDDKEHKTFIAGVSHMLDSQKMLFQPLVHKIARECCVKVKALDCAFRSKWLVVEQVGSDNCEVLEVANQLHLLPWVGVAYEVGRKDVSLGGRVFCCLPMPDEISSPLPVHVNGTFGLSDDRRTLKWKTTERQNDAVSIWNEMIVNKLLPSCYAYLIDQCTKRCHLSAGDVYSAWPDVIEVEKDRNWSSILEPFFNCLVKLNVLWTDDIGSLGLWAHVAEVVIVPSNADISVSTAIKKVMFKCGVKLVQVPNKVLNGLKYSKCKLIWLSPDLVRETLKANTQHYIAVCKQEKLILLSYCLSDKAYSKIVGMVLLPLLNGTFDTFMTLLSSTSKVFLCTKDYPCLLFKSFNTVHHLLIDEEYETELYDVAKSGATQLKLFDDKQAAAILHTCLPNPVHIYLPQNHLPTGWLNLFWKWSVSHNLDAFTGLFVVPLSHPSSSTSRLISVEDSSVILVDDDDDEDRDELLECIKKMHLSVTLSKDYPYLCHKNIFSFMHKLSANGLLRALHNIDRTFLNCLQLSNTDAFAIQGLLARINKITSSQLDVVVQIPILITSKPLAISVQNVKQDSWKGLIIVLPDDLPFAFFPSKMFGLSKSLNQIQFLQLLRPLGYVKFPTASELIMHTLLPMIADKTASKDESVTVMKEVLNFVDIDKYSEEISKLPFIKVDSTSVMKSPSELCNPSEELCKLFYKQPVFPLFPFNHPPYVTKLMRCGLKCTITEIEILNIIKGISKPKATFPQPVDEIAMTRSCAVLKHISDNTRDFQKVFNGLAVASSWLPIQCAAPEGYPKCLRWQGSHSHSHFISYCESVVLVKSDVIPYIAGSQVYMVRRECTFSPAKLNVLNCTSMCITKYVLAHFKEVIDNYKQMPEDTLLTIIHHTYTFLMEHCLQCDDLHTFSHPWIWTGDRFVHPKVVALKKKHRSQHSYEPYHYIIPTELHKYDQLFTCFGAQSETTDLQLVETIAAIKQKCELDEADALEMIICILNQLTAFGKKMVDLPGIIIYVPTESESLQLVNSKEVVYSDNECLKRFIAHSKSGKKYNVIHNRISSLAKCLHVAPLSNSISKNEYTFRNISQHEPLTRRLNNILRDYKDGLTIIKELIQNADDAGATEINICFDARTHNIDSKTLIFPGMASSHGPALVVHNNAQFTDADFENITKLAGATKMDEPLKIGKFGLGFCSVYHITDIPSLISGDSFVVFDPIGKHLSELESNQPCGQRIDLAHPIFNSSQQLHPYRGLYGFDYQEKYSGTIFRFPFRVVPSEISDNIYTEVSAEILQSDIFEAGSKLLIFLKNIAKITFSVFSKETKTPSTILELHKADGFRVCDGCYHCTIRKVQRKKTAYDHWLVSKCDDHVAYQGVQKYALASVACLLQCKSDKKLSVKLLDGESFCYLPLSCQTGLPVHISSNFAVLSNRRGIWTADNTVSHQGESESEWNIKLMQTVIPQAYVRLLNALKVLFEDDKLEDYNFYTVWPLAINLKQHDPWTHFIQRVYQIITSCVLFYSVFATKWLDIQSCQFLTPAILCLSNEYTSCAPEVMAVLRQLKVLVVMSPQVYQNEVEKNSTVRMFTEACFIDQFYCNVNFISVIFRVAVLKKMFIVYSLSKYDKGRFSVLIKYLVSKPSVPCIPDGELLRTCADVIDPKAVFARLFELNEKRFPMEIFCIDDIIYSAIKELGMISGHLPWTMLEERARQIPELYKRDAIDAMQRVEILLQCANDNIKSGIKPDTGVASKLSSIPCFPTKHRPVDFPLEWHGTGGLRCGKEMVVPSDRKFIDFGIIAGSQVCIVCSESPARGGCGDIPAKVLDVFGFHPKPTVPDVLNQLKQLIEFFSTTSAGAITSQIVRTSVKCATITHICSEVYRYLEAYATSNDDIQSNLHELQTLPCVWSGTSFIHPACIADQWRLNGPFLYGVPRNLVTTPKLRTLLNIKEQFSTCDIISALGKISDAYGMQPVDKNCHEVLRLAISELTNEETLTEGDVMMPSNTFVMHKAKEMYYRDDECWPIDKMCTMINENLVPNELARRLRVKPVRNKKLEMCGSHFGASAFGQREKLTQRIKNILREYPFDITVLKELLQNADDAKATKMFVILDCRNHGDKMVPSDEWKKLQGPALLVWNDSTFSDKDIEGIQKLGLGSKRLDAESIGQYGIGFNVVYHLTDCPSFITNDVLYVLDPHCKYVPQAEPLNPGGRYDLTDEFFEYFKDLKSPYLYTNLNCSQNFCSGSLFRFPLRHTLQLVKESEIAAFDNHFNDQNQEPVTISKMKRMIKDWAPDLKKCLYFLQNITEVKFCSIEAPSNSLTTLYHYKCNLLDSGIERHTMHSAFSSTNSKPCVVSYPLEVIELDIAGIVVCKEQWMIQQGVGDILNESQNWECMHKIKPRHGIAAPLNTSTPCSGQVFCFLPLPIKSGLPVHINGQFILDASRRALWTSTNPNQKDQRTTWNEKMFKSISSSYASLIASIDTASHNVKGSCDISAIANHVKNYYSWFPKWNSGIRMASVMEGCWLQLANDVYRKLADLNARVLCKVAPTGAAGILFWYPINAAELCDQIYFEDMNMEGKLKMILEQLGMNITSAPLFIRDHFKDMGIEIPKINPHTVYAHYTHLCISWCQIPCSIEKTAFQSVSNFKVFSKYVLQCDPPISTISTFHFPKSPFDYPLLVTADRMLRVIDERAKVLVSKYSRIFKSHSHMFLHPDLIELHYSKNYFLTPDECTFECINEMISSILPQELYNVHCLPSAHRHITQHALLSLWRCLSDDLVFKSKIYLIVQHWALLLTTGDELFSYRRDLVVPFVIDKDSLDDAILFPGVVDVLLTLGIPTLDLKIIGSDASPCPHTSDHSKMLHNLAHFHSKCDISSKLDETMVDSLIEYLQNINFHNNDDDMYWFLQLPLCMDVTESFRIPSKCNSYVWPNHFPSAGILNWVQRADVLFVKKNWKWTNFFSLVVKIHEISPEDMYLKYVFKHFSHLSEADRYEHLKYIRDYIQHSVSSALSNSLQALPCIQHDGTLRCISEFCDPRKKIFSLFSTHFIPLPSSFHDTEWLDFLSLLGLRKSPNKEEFVNFAHLVATGKVPDITQVSYDLLECLFEEEVWHIDSEFLSKVSVIPFVCVHSVHKVSWIVDACQTPSIKQGNVSVNMTQLSGSATKKHMGILWTVMPIVKLPKIDGKLLNALNVITHPSVSNVIANIKHICTCASPFSSTLLFENYPTSCQTPQGHQSLMDVMVENFQYLKDHNGFQNCQCLAELPCIPVHVNPEQTNFNEFVLVKPAQVMLDESASHFHPYLHALPDALSPFTQQLYTLGVAKILGLSHIRLALELVSVHECDVDSSCVQLDLNTNSLIQRLMVKLYSLLKQSDAGSGDSLKPLYLPSSRGKLTESSQLFYQDRGVYGDMQIAKHVTFVRLPEECHFTDSDLISLLPNEIRPKPLSKHCIEKLHHLSAIIQESTVADKLCNVLTSSSFRAAICAIVKRDTNEVSSYKKVDAFLKDIQDNMKVYEVEPLKVQLFATDTNHEIASTNMPVFIEVSGLAFNIYLKTKMTTYELHKIHNEIGTKFAEVICGGCVSIEMNFGCLSESIAVLVKTENTEEMTDYLLGLGIRFDGVASEQDGNITPMLGTRVPSLWLKYLDQKIGNIYRPEEWVAYEIEEGVMIFARILCPILHGLEGSSQLPKKYVIWISSEDTKEVTYIDLYKISLMTSSSTSSSTQQLVSRDTVPSHNEADGPARKRPRLDSMECAKSELLAELQEYWKLDKKEQNRALKRLYLEWHPDKNLDQVEFAEEMFKFLKHHIELHEHENGDSTDSNQTGTSSSNHWSSSFSSWDNFAHSHYRSAQSTNYTSQFSSRFNSQWQNPCGDSREAKRWLSQAEGDFEALIILHEKVATHLDVCCNVCFMAHEVAEKALKAGRYATSGMDSGSLKNHQLIYHAYAIMSERPEIAQGLDQFVTPLESYYLDTRFPNRHPGSVVPKSVYNVQHAFDAKEKAFNILRIIRSIIDEDRR